MDDQGPKWELKTDGHTTGKLGIKAAVTLVSDSKELYKNEVNLWQDGSRKSFAEGCIQVLNGDLPPRRAEEFRKRIAEWLIEEETKLKEAEGATPSSDGEPNKMSDQEREEALQLLKDPQLLGRVQDDLTTIGIVGEDRVKALVLLIATSRKMSKGLAATIKGSSSAGKNHLVRTVVSFMPEEEVQEFTQLSPKALYYMGEDGIKNKLVICTEIAGREGAEYSVRTLISEPSITSAIPVRDQESGPFQTQVSKVNGPIAYLDTTTVFNLHKENATRLFELYLNEGESQTRAILQEQAREVSEEAFAIEEERKRTKRVHQNAQRLLRTDLEVIIPYSRLIEYPPSDVRARRDFQKLLNLIKVVAYYHQFQRKIESTKDGRQYIEATLVDYELAYNIAKETFVETLDDLDKRYRDVLETVKKTLKQLRRVEFDRDDVASWFGRRKHKLSSVFNELERKEYFLDPKGQPIQGGGGKRTYILNQKLANEKPTFAAVTTPEELREKWKGQSEKGGQTVAEKPSVNQELLSLSPLSPPMEEEK